MDERLPFHCDEDLACTFLQHQLEFVDTFYNRKGVFRCEAAGFGEGEIEIAVHTAFGDPACEQELVSLEQNLALELSPSHRDFLLRWNGCTLFAQEDDPTASEGIRLYSVEELTRSESPQLLVIGEMLGTGNTLALDRTIADKDGEHPVVLLNHETLGMGSYELQILAPAITDLLVRIMASPADFFNDVGGGVRYYNAGRDWIPVEYRLV